MALHPDKTTRQGQIVQANGVNMHYCVHGQGEPLVLLHAGTLDADSWRPYLEAFAARYQVFTPDSRGHGRSDNPAGEMSYRLLADDMAAFMQALDLRRPLIAGYSDGGQIALEIGMHYPELPQCLIVGGATFKISDMGLAWVRDVLGDEGSPGVDTERFARSHPEWAATLQQIYGPERWKPLLAQIKRMWTTPLNYTPDDLARVCAPSLVMLGDRDELMPVEEAAEMCRLLPNAELSVIPGADHGAFFSARVTSFQSTMLDYLGRHGR
jgi:pimeloyl-ACP methyl ester carboxylesterase